MLAIIMAFITSRLGKWILGGALVALVAGGAYLYVHHLITENATLTRELAGYKRAVKIMKADAKTDAETDHEKDKIDVLPPEQFADYFNQLRRRARGKNPEPAEAGD